MKARRPTTALLVVLLVASAGCSGLVGTDGQPTETTTTAPTTDTTTESTTTTEATEQTPEQLAPGVTSEGVTDALALANAHEDIVSSSTFVRRSNTTRTNDSATITRQSRFAYVNDSHWQLNVTADGLPATFVVTNGTMHRYADGEVIVYRLQTPGNTTYGVANWDQEAGVLIPPAQFFADSSFESVFNREFVYSLVGGSDVTVEDASGDTVELAGSADELSIGGEPATDVEFTATVTADGLVESLHLTYQQDGMAVERSVTFDTSVSDPLTRPEWYQTAIDASPVNETSG